jgi:hypothetical protein
VSELLRLHRREPRARYGALVVELVDPIFERLWICMRICMQAREDVVVRCALVAAVSKAGVVTVVRVVL